MRPKRYFDLMCQDTDAEYDGDPREIELVVVEYPGTTEYAPEPRVLARFVCEICGGKETMHISTSDCFELQQYGTVPQNIEMPPEERTPTLTVDEMVGMINRLNIDEVLTIPSSMQEWS